MCCGYAPISTTEDVCKDETAKHLLTFYLWDTDVKPRSALSNSFSLLRVNDIWNPTFLILIVWNIVNWNILAELIIYNIGYRIIEGCQTQRK